ncbi:hypothetical protein [Oceanicaulis sp. MMSF_3324]|uniref:hypothetical protein n=1 Tax=Oceanicaulis sp. MMSF_3324 TaxID=3046702 RepID=UPI00273E2AC5|nr:hypothetical protein [Oceanicaulis sp. MMSF_3324]
MTPSLKLTASAAALVLGLSVPAFAQTFSGDPAYGVLSLESGATETGVRAGGAWNADLLEQGCYGFITETPTLAVNYQGDEDLYLSAGADEDTTMIVRAPDGSMHCDDDGAGDFNPGLVFAKADAGLYEVWLGTYGAGMGTPPARFHASTTGFDTSNPYTVNPNPALPGEQTARLRSGFRNDPYEIEVVAGGGARLESLGDMCYGYAGEAADLALSYRARSLPLYIAMESERDGVLAVQTPSGEMLCNDDAVGLNPGLHIDSPESGEYLIWAGLLGDRGATDAGVLSISEIGYQGVDRRLDLTATPRFGAGVLRAGFLPDPSVIEVEAGGPIQAGMAVEDGVTAIGYCTGDITREPTYELTYEAGGNAPLFISAISDDDTTLVVNGPDGAWMCDDDGGMGVNPLLTVENAPSGVYDIYVGRFYGEGETSDATLYISEIGGGADPVNSRVDISQPALFGDHALEAGFVPDPYRIQIEAGGSLEASMSGIASDEDWCAGHYTMAPTAQLDWTGGDGPLSIYVEGERDTTLAINMPDGSWRCNDDGGPGLSPALEFGNAMSGVYDIYVGVFSGEPASAELMISEFDAPSD